ncbi:helix-turn-helix domain-containing protein [Hyalangium versicolor]|uniref:helix-turn-helix domain-containing protein n=1 Tax=Hyalangium versicolor TaxID=2861190 RepID=UPI001CCAC144|nr:helix-turn-helix transcriptional regulator [Hyalangium versicolor]
MSVSLQELGEQVQAARAQKNLSQEALAKAISPPTNRSVVAHLEQGRRVPAPEVLTRLCEFLGIPSRFWKAFLEEDYRRRLLFEEALSELVGRVVSLRTHDEHTIDVANSAVLELFKISRTPDQAFDAFNSVLVFYDVPQCSKAFFDRYFGPDAIRSAEELLNHVRAYQKDAIRLFSTFEHAYEQMNDTLNLSELLAPLAPRKDDKLRTRSNWETIEIIPDDRLPDLGYISAEKARQEHDERELLAAFLREAGEALSQDKSALANYSEKKKRKMDSLLRKFNSNIQHGFLSPLFTPDPDALRREADYLAPKEASDLARMADTQATAQRNLARYLAADHLDVYVATSMRSDADFVSVNNFCLGLFNNPALEPLRLRYFNPTQSWIEDRVAKGLVEALMLKRSAMTLYMAQKSDTFGKDSEASVALGQGKPVIVYVPRLYIPEIDLNTESLGQKSRADLQQLVAREGNDEDKEPDETMDVQALLSRLITIRLNAADDLVLIKAAQNHWADFDLYGEATRIKEEERGQYRSWLDAVVRKRNATPPSPNVRTHLIGILVAAAVGFERRAKTFREQHPLALQVILSTGVLNGILVTRAIDSCAQLVRALIRNEVDSDLEIDDNNYRLVERTTRSTMRVISRHTMIANAFTAFYKRRRAQIALSP